MATSALSVGYDYPYVRYVLHAGPPRRITDFAQESGRAGRDRQPAKSIILMSPSALAAAAAGRARRGGEEEGRQLRLAGPLRPDPASRAKGLDEEVMQLYLTQRHCLRGVIS